MVVIFLLITDVFGPNRIGIMAKRLNNELDKTHFPSCFSPCVFVKGFSLATLPHSPRSLQTLTQTGQCGRENVRKATRTAGGTAEGYVGLIIGTLICCMF